MQRTEPNSIKVTLYFVLPGFALMLSGTDFSCAARRSGMKEPITNRIEIILMTEPNSLGVNLNLVDFLLPGFINRRF
jgi:hypothetical protein